MSLFFFFARITILTDAYEEPLNRRINPLLQHAAGFLNREVMKSANI